MILVALAGPGMNLVLAIVGAIVLAITFAMAQGELHAAAGFVAANALNFVSINLFLGVFNLLPVPPFDGGHVVEGLLPRSMARNFRKIGRYSLLVFIALLLVLPAISPSADVVGRVVSPIVDGLARALLWIVGIRG
jgi:Zn-dependent protease